MLPGRTWLEAGFPALRHRNFRLFVLGQGTSLIGFWMQSVAQGWLVYRLSGSAFAVGLVAFSGYVPILCCAPAAGVLVDRVSRHRLLIATQHGDVDVEVSARLVPEEHVERAAAGDPPRCRDQGEELLHLFEAERLPTVLGRRDRCVLHQNPSL